MTDDMRPDEMAWTADLRPNGGFDWIRDHGVQFPKMRSGNNICCPARATALTGQTSYNNGVFQIGFQDLRTSLPLWLQRAGYCTGFTGKIFNGYFADKPRPPGWTYWEPLTDTNWKEETGYEIVRRNGTVESPDDFVTDHLATVSRNQLVDCLNSASPAFIALWPRAPHLYSDPKPEYNSVPVPWSNSDPSFNEADYSDKPAWMQAAHPSPRNAAATWAKAYSSQRVRTLLSVDEALDQLLDNLRARNQLENTLVILTSDNGYLMGEHRFMNSKVLPFEAAQPAAWIAGPGFPESATSAAFVTNLDLAPTIIESSGAVADLTMDGRSLQSVLASPTLGRDRFVPVFIPQTPGGDAVMTSRYKYSVYKNGQAELYDLVTDPYEEVNVVDSPSYAGVRTQMQQLLNAAKVCSGDSCRASVAPSLRAP
jgi:arylsulfatase A-like enzyme